MTVVSLFVQSNQSLIAIADVSLHADVKFISKSLIVDPSLHAFKFITQSELSVVVCATIEYFCHSLKAYQ
jgi:hypothetical protein